MSKLALRLIKEAKEKRLKRLELGMCGLTEIPDGVFELVWLEELILSNEWDEYDGSKYKAHHLSFNHGKRNAITSISTKIECLSKLKILQISGSFELKWLLNDISSIGNLTELRVLELHDTFVEDLSPLSKLFNLELLALTRTNIKSIEPLKSLKNLLYLNIGATEVKDLTALCQLNKLKDLVAFGTKIVDINPLIQLKQVERLFLDGTNVKNVDSLKEWSKLKYLGLQNSCVADISPLKLLLYDGLEVYFPDSNQITNPNLGNKKVFLENCPLTNPPIEIAKQGNEAILNYWKQIDEQGGKVELNEAKLIIVGEGGTGKTTLFEKLKNPAHVIGNTPETHGINIHEGLPVLHTHAGKDTFYANLWDFGGQELQYMTHQFFLTPRALYILMIDSRKEVGNLPYWFKIISLLGRYKENSSEKVRLLLVFNKRGNTTGQPPQYQDQLKYYDDSLDVQYLEVDFAENDFRFENLKSTIEQSLVTLPIVKSQLPRMWKVVRGDLREAAQTQDYISTKQLSEICNKHGILEEEDQWALRACLGI